VFLAAGFAFQGTELVGITAGESKNPRRDVPKAVNQVFWRILLFYVLAIFLIGLIIPYNDPRLLNPNNDVSISPFTLVVLKAGVSAAGHVMNAVILITVLSAGNSGLYAASRTLYQLAQEGKAPRILKRTTKGGVPYIALLLTALVGVAAFFTALAPNNSVYMWLLSLSAVSGFIAWFGISISHYRFRKAYRAQGRYLEDLPYKARLYPFGPIFAAVMILIVIFGQGYSIFSTPGFKITDVIAAYIGIPLFIMMYLGYKLINKTEIVPIMEMDLDTGRQVYMVEHDREMMRRELEEQRASAGNLWQRLRHSSAVRALDWI